MHLDFGRLFVHDSTVTDCESCTWFLRVFFGPDDKPKRVTIEETHSEDDKTALVVCPNPKPSSRSAIVKDGGYLFFPTESDGQGTWFLRVDGGQVASGSKGGGGVKRGKSSTAITHTVNLDRRSSTTAKKKGGAKKSTK